MWINNRFKVFKRATALLLATLMLQGSMHGALAADMPEPPSEEAVFEIEQETPIQDGTGDDTMLVPPESDIVLDGGGMDDMLVEPEEESAEERSEQTEEILQEEEDHELAPFFVSSKLYKGDVPNMGLPREEDEVIDGATVSFDDPMTIAYFFEMSEDELIKIDASENKNYTIPMPKGLIWSGNKSLEQPIYAFVEGSGARQFGTLYIEQPDNAYVVFESDLAENFGTLEQAFVLLGCHLDKVDIGSGDEELTIEIYEFSVTVKVKENQKKDPELKKTGKYDEDIGSFVWTINYTPGTKPVSAPLYLVDTFQNEKHIFVSGSLMVNGGKADEAVYKIADVGGATQITYELPESEDAVTLRYETTLTDEAVAAAGTINVENTVALADSEGKTLLDARANASVTLNANKLFIEKDGNAVKTDSRMLDWKVTVFTRGRNIKDLVLHDVLPDGLTLKESSIRINEITAAEANADLEWSESSREMTISLAAPYAQKYEIKYQTAVDEAYFEAGKEAKFNNEAWLTFDWLATDGGMGGSFDEDYRTPTVGKELTTATALVSKRGLSYDRVNHRFQWQVTVNPNGVDVQNMTITDDLNRYAGRYPYNLKMTYAGGFACEDARVEYVESEPDKPIFKVGNIGKQTVVFTFYATVDDPQYYANNMPGESGGVRNVAFKNRIDALADIKTNEGALLQNVKSNAEATHNTVSQVMSKKGLGYDFTTHKITWELVVNQNQMPMQNVCILDEIQAGQTYVERSASITNGIGSLSEKLDDSGNVTFALGDISGQLTIRFETLVDVNDPANDLYYNATANLKNRAILKRDQYADQAVMATQAVKNELLGKEGTLVEGDSVEYVVNINPNQLALNDLIVDQMPESLLLDQDTVKLYKAQVAANGTLTATDETVNLANRFLYDAGGRSFSIKLGGEEQAYILKYTAFIVESDEKEIINQISFKGESGASGGSDSSIQKPGGGGAGGGVSTRRGSLSLTKLDGLRGEFVIPGVVFGVFEKNEDGSAGTQIDEQRTDTEGKLKFGALKRGQTYIIRELYTPNGYQALVDFEIYIPATGAAHLVQSVENMPVTATVSFDKESDWGRPLTGAKFTLTDKTPGSKLVLTSESQNGRVTFENVPFGVYELRETDAPAKHELDLAVYNVTVHEDGTVSAITDAKGKEVPKLVNIAKKTALILTKIDRDSKEPMQDVQFTLRDSAGIIRGAGKTNVDGKMTFAELAVGETYTLHETTPSGYRPAEDKTFTLDDETKAYEILWENVRKSSGGSGGGSDPKPVPKPDPTPEVPEIDVMEPDVPQGGHPDGSETPDVEIEETDVPLASKREQSEGAGDTKTQESGAPQTGDKAPVGALMALVVLAGAGLLMLRRRNGETE